MEIPKIESQPGVKGCVFKLFWGDAYIIAKCHYFDWYKNTIEQALYSHFKKNKPDLLYNRFFGFIRTHPFYTFRVKILFQSESPYRLLCREQEELEKAQADANCFNTSFEAYVPKGIQGKRKSWISRGTYLNFMMWKKRRRAKTAL
jgi:hypothetical protein